MEKYTYELKQTENPVWEYVERSDGARIPIDPANSDYQRYLNPEAEQSTPIVVDEAETI
jgi:hypothetical protein